MEYKDKEVEGRRRGGFKTRVSLGQRKLNSVPEGRREGIASRHKRRSG